MEESDTITYYEYFYEHVHVWIIFQRLGKFPLKFIITLKREEENEKINENPAALGINLKKAK